MAASLIEKLASIANAKPGGPMPECMRQPDNPDPYATDEWGPLLSVIAQESIDRIESLQKALFESIDVGKKFLSEIPAWQPLVTAPVPPFDKDTSHHRFRCLLQTKSGWVFEGDAHYVQLSRAKDAPMTLRWYDANNRLCSPPPLYWMPLPAPRVEVPST